MTDRRQVTDTDRDQQGHITALSGPDASWSPRQKADVISDIEQREQDYYVEWLGGLRTDIHTVHRPDGTHLRTDRDNSARNNMNDLPDHRALNVAPGDSGG
jgi:hypothetical protein